MKVSQKTCSALDFFSLLDGQDQDCLRLTFRQLEEAGPGEGESQVLPGAEGGEPGGVCIMHQATGSTGCGRNLLAVKLPRFAAVPCSLSSRPGGGFFPGECGVKMEYRCLLLHWLLKRVPLF